MRFLYIPAIALLFLLAAVQGRELHEQSAEAAGAAVSGSKNSIDISQVSCSQASITQPNAPTVRRRCTATPTPTPRPARTATATPTRTPTPSPTAKSVPSPTATPTDTPGSPPQAGEVCPKAVHDRYVTTGPDGKSYPTWHPAVDPQSGCVFGHEHGSDPRLARANTSMPVFGYIGGLIGDSEPHEGFKVFYSNAGEVTEGQTVNVDTRVVFHMGTGGVKRYSTQFHSIVYDYIARDGSGREAHIQGMADTGDTSTDGSGCDIRGHKSFSTIGCDNDYEVWAATKFQVIHPDDPNTDILSTRVTLTFSPAVFDPITTRDPRNNSVLIYTQKVRGDPNVDPLSPDAQYLGCSRESYFGPSFWHNAGGPTVYYTDVYGHVNPSGPDAAHPLKQIVASRSSTANDQFKIPRNYCDTGVHAPN